MVARISPSFHILIFLPAKRRRPQQHTEAAGAEAGAETEAKAEHQQERASLSLAVNARRPGALVVECRVATCVGSLRPPQTLRFGPTMSAAGISTTEEVQDLVGAPEHQSEASPQLRRRRRGRKPAASPVVSPAPMTSRCSSPPRLSLSSASNASPDASAADASAADASTVNVSTSARPPSKMQSVKKRRVDASLRPTSPPLECPGSPPSLRILGSQEAAMHTARQRFVMDSEDDDESASPFFGSASLPPRLVTSKSEGRTPEPASTSTGATMAQSTRRRHRQALSQQDIRAVAAAAAAATPSLQPQPWSEPSRGVFLSRDQLVRRYFGGVAEHSRSMASLDSQSSLSASLPTPRETGFHTAAMEPGFITSSTYSSSTYLTDDMLLAAARHAKKQLEAVAKRQVLVGRWKRMTRSKPDCQMFESVSKTKDQYSVVAKMNLPCSLREIMSVFSTDNAAEFHRSMEALFGDQYVYGVNTRSVDCPARHGGGLRSRVRSRSRRSSEPAAWRPSQTAAAVSPLCATKLRLNSITLMQKHRLVWKQRSMAFLDYLEEKLDSKSVTRVMQTMDLTEDDAERRSMGGIGSPLAPSTLQESTQPQTQHPQKRVSTNARDLKGILAGYVIQEDSEEKFTRFFFYATHRHQSGPNEQTKMTRSPVQLLRAMVSKVCLLESVVLRRRLGYYPLSAIPSSPDTTPATAYCAACYTPFSLLRKKHFCRLCGHYTCRKCSSLQEVEKTVGLVEKHRVCVACVRRVGYCVFSMGAFPPKSTSVGTATATGSSWTPAGSTTPIDLLEGDEDEIDSPPILDDLASTDIEDVAVVDSEGRSALKEYLSGAARSKERRQELSATATDRKKRLQLTIEDLGTWVAGPLGDGMDTPKESISLLDSFCTSQSSSGSRSRDLPAWLSPSPTGA